MNAFEQLHERRLVVEFRKFMATVKVNDLPQERDFFDAARNQMAHFGYDLTDGAAAFAEHLAR